MKKSKLVLLSLAVLCLGGCALLKGWATSNPDQDRAVVQAKLNATTQALAQATDTLQTLQSAQSLLPLGDSARASIDSRIQELKDVITEGSATAASMNKELADLDEERTAGQSNVDIFTKTLGLMPVVGPYAGLIVTAGLAGYGLLKRSGQISAQTQADTFLGHANNLLAAAHGLLGPNFAALQQKLLTVSPKTASFVSQAVQDLGLHLATPAPRTLQAPAADVVSLN